MHEHQFQLDGKAGLRLGEFCSVADVDAPVFIKSCKINVGLINKFFFDTWGCNSRKVINSKKHWGGH